MEILCASAPVALPGARCRHLNPFFPVNAQRSQENALLFIISPFVNSYKKNFRHSSTKFAVFPHGLCSILIYGRPSPNCDCLPCCPSGSPRKDGRTLITLCRPPGNPGRAVCFRKPGSKASGWGQVHRSGRLPFEWPPLWSRSFWQCPTAASLLPAAESERDGWDRQPGRPPGSRP